VALHRPRLLTVRSTVEKEKVYGFAKLATTSKIRRGGGK